MCPVTEVPPWDSGSIFDYINLFMEVGESISRVHVQFDPLSRFLEEMAVCGTHGLVAMTTASHAVSRQFYPGMVYFSAPPEYTKIIIKSYVQYCNFAIADISIFIAYISVLLISIFIV